MNYFICTLLASKPSPEQTTKLQKPQVQVKVIKLAPGVATAQESGCFSSSTD